MKSTVQDIHFISNGLACRYYPEASYIEIQRKGEVVKIDLSFGTVIQVRHLKRSIK